MIEMLIEGRLSIAADGQMELPKQPPFAVLTPGWAALVTVQLEPESPRCIRVFDAWYMKGADLDVVAHDGRGTWIRAAMLCVGLERHQGIQTTRAWSSALGAVPSLPARPGHGWPRLHMARRASPRHQRIARSVYRYTLAAQRYAFVGPLQRPRTIQHEHDRAH